MPDFTHDLRLWLDNEEADYTYWREAAHEAAQEASSCSQVREGYWTAEEAAKYNLADRMKDEITERAYGALSDVWLELVTSALCDVDWHSIAEAYLEDIEIPPGDGEDEEEEDED